MKYNFTGLNNLERIQGPDPKLGKLPITKNHIETKNCAKHNIILSKQMCCLQFLMLAHESSQTDHM